MHALPRRDTARCQRARHRMRGRACVAHKGMTSVRALEQVHTVRDRVSPEADRTPMAPRRRLAAARRRAAAHIIRRAERRLSIDVLSRSGLPGSRLRRLWRCRDG